MWLTFLSCFTCLKVFFESLQAVSTVNFVLKMLQSFAPYPLRPPKVLNVKIRLTITLALFTLP